MHRKFPSLGKPSEFGFAFDSGTFDIHAPIEPHFRMFQTYGDGLCQHSSDWSVTMEHLPDYLASLADAMVNDEELLTAAAYPVCQRPTDKDIAFAATVVFKPDATKRTYVNMKERKLSSSPNKVHDKRWEEVASWADGSAFATWRLLIPEWASGMMKYCYADAVRDWCLAQEDGPYCQLPGQLLKWYDDHDKCRGMHNAYTACLNLARGNQLRHNAIDTLENYKRMFVASTESA